MPETIPTEFLRYWRTNAKGKRTLTRWKVRRSEIPPGCEPDEGSVEIRHLNPPGTPMELRQSGAL